MRERERERERENDEKIKKINHGTNNLSSWKQEVELLERAFRKADINDDGKVKLPTLKFV